MLVCAIGDSDGEAVAMGLFVAVIVAIGWVVAGAVVGLMVLAVPAAQPVKVVPTAIMHSRARILFFT